MSALRRRAIDSLVGLLPQVEQKRVEEYLMVDAGHGTDVFGMDRDGLGAAYACSWWLHEHWFSVKSRGHQHVPTTGAGVVVSNHSGVLPFDDVPWTFAGREQGGETERLSLSYFLSYPPPRDLNPNTPDALARIVYNCLIVPDYGLSDLETDLVDFLRKE